MSYVHVFVNIQHLLHFHMLSPVTGQENIQANPSRKRKQMELSCVTEEQH